MKPKPSQPPQLRVMLTALIVLLLPELASATLVRRNVTLTWMLQRTAYAFGGTVARNEAARDSLSGNVYTEVVFADLAMAYGDNAGDSLTAFFLGGMLNGRGYDLDIQPRFEVGQRYIVLLGRTKGERTTFYLPAVGGTLGVYRVIGGRVFDYWERAMLGLRDDSLEVVAARRQSVGGRAAHRPDLYAGTGPFRVLSNAPNVGAGLTERALLRMLSSGIKSAQAKPPARY